MQFKGSVILLFLFGCFTVVHSRSYTVLIITGSSDTSSRVEIKFVGDIGTSSAHILTPRGGTFKRLSKYAFRGLNDRDVGELNGVEIYLHSGSSSSWPIKKVLVVSNGRRYVFVNYQGDIYPGKWTYIRANCPFGFKKASDGSCVDNNECLLANGGCETFCHNNVGSYTCSCRSGFELYNKLRCRDIDECARKTDDCDDQSTTCYNYKGIYECRCKKGFKYIPNNKRRCELITCHPVVEAQGTSVSPSECLVKNGRKVGDQCTFSCKAGYFLPDPSKNTMTCLDTSGWDMALIYCRPKRCPSLTPPANGYVYPPFCSTTGNTFKQSCYYQCNKGYTLKNDQNPEIVCTKSGAWSNSTPATCVKVFVKPWINCPTSVMVTLAPNASHADVTALLSKPRSNVDDVKMFPEKYRTSLVFPAGTTKLTYKATNKNGDFAQCTTNIIIEDKEPPKVVYCPPNIYKVVNGQSTQVSWTLPKFSDNVGVTKVTSTHNPGDTFKVGPLPVYYTASDAAGNTISTCSFDVNVKKAECPKPPAPDGGTISVHDFNGYKYATIKCNPGKQVFIGMPTINCHKDTLKWDPVPDCVDSVPMPSSGICDQGYVKKGGIHSQNICVKCPRGYAYDTVTKNCTKCPKGQYSDRESSLSCTPCPLNQGTLTDGAKACLHKCSPGQASANGFENFQCQFCRQGFYEDRYGSTACKACPSGLSTLSIGASHLNDCGVRPSFTEFVVQPNNVTEGNQVDIICKGTGVLAPSFSIKKVVPTLDGFGGPVMKSMILDDSRKVLGLRYTITETTVHDAGSYECEIQNKFGKSESSVTLRVKLNTS
ncbi:sushi, von Willebrand factor type A, EGF and pentraxin domain-containing protein 1-like [Actinia tenebrosa]|uniref:Sushi, von Willebrand factor type A, EGF and pentraxin domain-containing protein 1-like n=1 Tax=Actinia tenebrosa TaxID=6105 RepID=A0A6P8HJ87_ACTTE|nr:sushi, von Willebrand factor type A, EGF and pentraxin domain-containing protein 1-like [Actinia tenebrosa]